VVYPGPDKIVGDGKGHSNGIQFSKNLAYLWELIMKKWNSDVWWFFIVSGCSILMAANIESIKKIKLYGFSIVLWAIVIWLICSLPWFIASLKRRKRP
jgi:hypothetical protein